jgi:hypothetical protein
MKRSLWMTFLFVGMAVLYPPKSVLAQRNAPASERSRPATPVLTQSSPGFFPLEVGNEWIYSDGTDSFEVKVMREVQEDNGMKYFEISGYLPGDPAGARKIRRGPLGQILEYNPDGQDFLWYRFGIFSSVLRFETAGDIPCITGSLLMSGGIRETVVTPAGIFDDTLRLGFQSPCADAGILAENFAGGVGLVERVLQTIAGPRTYRLTSARVGSLELPVAKYGIQVSMDYPIYYNNLMPSLIFNPWPKAQVMLVVRNTTVMPVQLTFPTSQRFDFIVRDALGNEVLRWSDGRVFLQVVVQETLVNESRHYPAEVTLKGRAGEVLAPGFYTLTGYLTLQNWASGISRMLGTVTFEIQNVY